MPLSVDNPIIANDIYHIRMFKALKVWLLTGGNNDQIVIKTDAVQQPQYKSASPIVKAVAPGARLKILTAAERGQLSLFLDTYDDIAQFYESLGTAYNANEAPAVNSLRQSLGFGFPFVKMAAVNVKDLEGALDNRLAPAANKTDLRAFTATLKAPGGLERLGKIIAVDLFNGNTDRFYPGSASVKTIGGIDFNLRCLVNVGNVFRVDTGGGGSEVGALDFIDPNSRFRDMNTPLAQAETAAHCPWPGRILADKGRRKAFAEDVVHDLEKLLGPRKSRLSLVTKLGGDAAGRVSKGMVQGAQLIKAKLEAKYNPNRWTAGVRERYVIICQAQ